MATIETATEIRPFQVNVPEPVLERLRHLFTEWATAETIETLANAEPILPEDLDHRRQDIWEPLLAIADLAGDQWPQRARAAAVALHEAGQDSASVGELLLAHVRDAFADQDRITTIDLLTTLVDRDDGPWAAWWARDVERRETRKPAAALARKLRAFAVTPKKVRVGDVTRQGYERAAFLDVWERYLPDVGTKTRSLTIDVPTDPSVPTHGKEGENQLGLYTPPPQNSRNNNAFDLVEATEIRSDRGRQASEQAGTKDTQGAVALLRTEFDATLLPSPLTKPAAGPAAGNERARGRSAELELGR